MLLYCLKCRKNIEYKYVNVGKSRRIMILSKCAVCDSKKFLKEQEVSGLLSSLEMKRLLSIIPLICPFLFSRY